MQAVSENFVDYDAKGAAATCYFSKLTWSTLCLACKAYPGYMDCYCRPQLSDTLAVIDPSKKILWFGRITYVPLKEYGTYGFVKLDITEHFDGDLIFRVGDTVRLHGRYEEGFYPISLASNL